MLRCVWKDMESIPFMYLESMGCAIMRFSEHADPAQGFRDYKSHCTLMSLAARLNENDLNVMEGALRHHQDCPMSGPIRACWGRLFPRYVSIRNVHRQLWSSPGRAAPIQEEIDVPLRSQSQRRLLPMPAAAARPQQSGKLMV